VALKNTIRYMWKSLRAEKKVGELRVGKRVVFQTQLVGTSERGYQC